VAAVHPQHHALQLVLELRVGAQQLLQLLLQIRLGRAAAELLEEVFEAGAELGLPHPLGEQLGRVAGVGAGNRDVRCTRAGILAVSDSTASGPTAARATAAYCRTSASESCRASTRAGTRSRTGTAGAGFGVGSGIGRGC